MAKKTTTLSDLFPDGITEYSAFRLEDFVYFPKGYVACKWCRYCLYDRNNTSYRCVVNDATLYVIDKGVGINCPLEVLENDGTDDDSD